MRTLRSFPLAATTLPAISPLALCTPVAEAEKIKRLYGNAIVTLIPDGNEVEVPSVGDRPSRLISQRMVGEILEPRARELFEMLRDNLRHTGMLDLCVGGIVLSGGASRLPGILDIAESVLRRPVRLSWPAPMAKMPSTLAEPEYATVLGMAFYGHRARIARGIQDDRWSSRLMALLWKRGMKEHSAVGTQHSANIGLIAGISKFSRG